MIGFGELLQVIHEQWTGDRAPSEAADELIQRSKETYDGAMPSGNAMMALLSQPTAAYPLKDGKTTFYICRDHSCLPATNDPDRRISRAERLVSRAYSLGDNDLAWDNLENDLPDADLQDL